MTRSELIEMLAQRYPNVPFEDVDAVARLIQSAMFEALASGGRIEIRGFGSFSLTVRPPRMGRNPRTGEKVAVPAKALPHFKAGKELRERVDAAAKAREPAATVA